jgi:hypothetical protein
MKAVRRATVLALVALGVMALQATAAGATTTIGTAHKYKYVQNTISVSGGGTPFTNSAACGPGFIAASGGMLMTGNAGEPRMTGNFTAGTHGAWQSAGFNTGFGKNTTTVGLCRPDTADIAYVQQKKTLPAAPSTVGAQATCPGDRLLLSGGVTVQGPLSQVRVSRSFPDGAQRAWKAKVVNHTGGERSFWVFAECLPATVSLAYWQSSLILAPSPSGIFIDMPCQAGTVPVSGGASWNGDQTQAHIGSSGPIDSGGGVSSIPDAVWRLGVANDTGANKTVTGYVVCAKA